MGKRRQDYLLVDGYNVIFDWKELKDYKEDFDHARDRLVDWLASYGAFKGYKVLVVFDAYSFVGQERVYPVYPNLEVIFTSEKETADSFIERTAYRLAKGGMTVYVATSDGTEQQVILGVGAYRISARELRLDVLKTAKRMKERAKGQERQTDRNELEGRVKDEVREKLNALRLQR
ncbi:MAG: NYN domain-containing protein [Sporomusaceae bacterium]|nr:NYN domain-containing protein [Sporomusaceae bacterium]